jgi:hypothetical protein
MVKVAYPRTRLPWTDIEEQKIRLWFETKSTREIADLLGRTTNSVYARAKALGLGTSR